MGVRLSSSQAVAARLSRCIIMSLSVSCISLPERRFPIQRPLRLLSSQTVETRYLRSSATCQVTRAKATWSSRSSGLWTAKCRTRAWRCTRRDSTVNTLTLFGTVWLCRRADFTRTDLSLLHFPGFVVLFSTHTRVPSSLRYLSLTVFLNTPARVC